MRRCLLVVCLLASGAFGAEDLGPKLSGWTYQVDAPALADQYADPGDRLTDGVTDRSKVAIWRAGNVTVAIDLGGLARLTGLRVYQYRHNTNYKLDHLAVMAEKGGQWIELARTAGFNGPTPTMDFVHSIPLKGLETARLRLDFVGVGVLSLAEVELFGTRPAAGAAGGAYAGVPFGTDAGPVAREADLDGDGKPEVVLENRWVRLILAPSQGGVCRSLRLKPSGVELVDSRESGYGLLRDQLWKPNYSFGERFYFHRVETSAELATVELWTTGSGGMMSFTEVRKRLTLRRDGADVRVHYTLTNQPSSQTEYEYGFWSHNWLGVAGATNRYFFPTTSGVQQFTLDGAASRRSGEEWYREPSQGWTAVVSDQGTGLVMCVPYRYLNLFYRWHGAGSLASTHEWRLNRITLKAGEKLEFDVALLPVERMRQVTGVVDGVVTGIEPGPDKVTVSLAQPAGSPAFGGHLRMLPVGRNFGLPPLAAPTPYAAVSAVLPVTTDDRTVRVEVTRGGRTVGHVDRPLAPGAVWTLAPEGERIGRQDDQAEPTGQPVHTISTAVETPHIPWARPYAGGRLKALVLLDDLNSREAVELAQRCDLDLDYVKFRTTLEKELLWQGDLSIQTLEGAQRRLSQKLAAGRYDVLITAGLNWGFHLSAANRQAILSQVREGTGLLLIQPDGFDAAAVAELPVAGVPKKGNAARPYGGWHAWQPAGESPLTAAMDWSRFPLTRRHEYDTKPQGQVIATVGKDQQPLLTLGQVGRGRVVSATWDTLTHELSYRGYSGLTPILSYRGGWLRPDFAELPEGYHELWFALLCRLTTWAAGRDSGVTITAPATLFGDTDSQDKLTLPVKLAGNKLPQALRYEVYPLTPRGPASGQLAGKLFGGAISGEAFPAEATVALPLPRLPVGDSLVCYTLRRADGAALAWGFATARLTGPAALKQVAVDPDTQLPEGGVWQRDGAVETNAFRPARPIQLRASLAAPAGKALTAELVAQDTYGRTVIAATRPVPRGATTVAVEVPAPTLVAQGLELTVRLRDGERVIDVARARAVTQRPRVWQRFWLTSWESNWLWRTHYLFDPLDRIVRDWGLDVAFYGDNELNTGRVREGAYWDINHSWLGLLEWLGPGVPSFGDADFARKAAEYARTKDTQYLVRKPSLVDPAWREKLKTRLLERVGRTMTSEGGAYDYCMGDEMSLTHYTQFHDFDWSPESLNDFRAWLQRRYPDLAALNRAWGTSHTDWAAVVPLTREQARTAANPAPWAEFRTYMNDQLASFYGFVQDTIRTVDPQAHCGLSGTQSPEAANGMDWWKVGRGFSYYHSYNTSWSNEMRRSFQAYGGAEQSPYFAGYSVSGPGCEYNLWWCLFHETRGISAWKTGLFWYGDFTETPSGRDTRTHLETFRRGAWRLLRGAKRQSDGVAIYYSMPTIIAGALTGDEQRINSARDAWVKLINDAGLQYDFVAAPQVAEGLLDGGGYKVVVLPHTLALSKAEADALRRFVARGGTLLATRPPGERDELCRLQSPGLLDDLFGFKRSGTKQAVEPKLSLKQAYAGLPAGTEVRLPAAVSDLATDAATALATAGAQAVPALLRGAAGRAVLLNVDLSDFESERQFHSPTESQFKTIVAALLADAGVRPKVRITTDSGKPPLIEVVRYELDGVEYLGLLNNDRRALVATVDLGARKRVYDVRGGAALGEMDKLTVPFDSAGARLYALAAAPLPPPLVTAPATVAREVSADGVQRGGELTLTLSHARGPRQLFRVDLADAAGRARRELRQTVWVAGEPVRTVVPLSLTDPVGDWTVTVTDVASGQQASAKVAVK